MVLLTEIQDLLKEKNSERKKKKIFSKKIIHFQKVYLLLFSKSMGKKVQNYRRFILL